MEVDLVRYDPYGYPIFPGERGYNSCGGEVDRFDNQEKPAMSNIEVSDVQLGVSRGGLNLVFIAPSIDPR